LGRRSFCRSSPTGSRFCLYVHHDDAKREWAYDRASIIGHLDKGLDEAAAKGWTVVSMKTDWKHIFTFEKSPTLNPKKNPTNH